MSVDSQDFTVREILQFILDSVRFMKAVGTLPRDWSPWDTSELTLSTTNFRSQSLVRLVDNVVRHSRSDESGASPHNLSQLNDVIKILQQSLVSKLEWLAEQGVFDPLLPWIGSIIAENKTTVARLLTISNKHGKSNSTVQVFEVEPEAGANEEDTNKLLGLNEVTIHVVDDVRGGQKDFVLPSNILLEKMPYFAKATRGQVLADVDITVHCDVHIFEWLTRWMNSPNTPSLEPGNVVPVLLSAAFLETEQLVEECLNFCHNYTNLILETKQSFSCLSDSLIEKLAAKFTNSEVEQLGHQKSSLQARLYICLITDLCEGRINPKRGIFKSAATLFQCSLCGNFLTEEIHLRIPCIIGRVVITRSGKIFYRHQRAESWNLSEYIQSLKASLKSWRRVYWRLWGLTHFLECSSCGLPFAAADFLKCPFHPENSHYMSTSRNKGNFQPVGKFSCCQGVTYRFSTIPLNTGCRMKEHTVSCLNLEQIQIMTMSRQYAELVHVSPSLKGYNPSSNVVKPANATDEDVAPRFILGFQARPRRHLVPLPWQPEQSASKENRPKTASSSQDSMSTTGSAESDEKFRKTVNILDPLCYEEDEDMPEDETEDMATSNKPSGLGRDGNKRSNQQQMFVLRRKFLSRRDNKLKPQPPPREVDLRWNPCLSSRSNQDNQRYLEEEMIRRIMNVLTPQSWQKPRSPAGGVFAKITRNLQEKAHKEPRQNKLTSSVRSALTAALATRKFKAQLHMASSP